MQIRLPRPAARGRWLAGVAAFAVLAGAGTWTAVADDSDPEVQREDRVHDMPGAKIDTSYFTTGGDARRPAVLIGHGFGGSKDDVRAQAEQLARDGYAVLTWSARGFGNSTGRIGLNDPDHEVKDVSRLIDWLAERPEVRLDGDGDPRVGITGSSYGGAISLLGAGYDRRVDAIAPQITYWNLADALFPDGVFKKLWAGIFFSTGSVAGGGLPGVNPPGGERPGGEAPAGEPPSGERADGADGAARSGGRDGGDAQASAPDRAAGTDAAGSGAASRPAAEGEAGAAGGGSADRAAGTDTARPDRAAAASDDAPARDDARADDKAPARDDAPAGPDGNRAAGTATPASPDDARADDKAPARDDAPAGPDGNRAAGTATPASPDDARADDKAPARDDAPAGPDGNRAAGTATPASPDDARADDKAPARDDAPAGDRAATPANPAGCGRFAPELCAMYERVAVAGQPDAAARKLLEARSPSAVGDRIDVPTLIVQGQSDSLFPLSHADAIATAVARNGGPVAVDWIAGGHDGGDRETARVEGRIGAWFDRHLKGDESADTGPAFRVSRTGGVDSTDGQATLRGASADRYPGLSAGPREFPLAGREQTFSNPAGATPPAISAVPGLSGGAGALSSLGVGLSLDFPGQYAAFTSGPVDRAVRVTGSPRVTATVGSDTGDAVLFAKVYDVGPDGRQQVLPSQLVAPVRVEDAGEGRKVTLTLPAVDHEIDAGHRLRLVLSATDLGYASPAEPAAYTVSLDGPLAVPTAPAVTTRATGFASWVWALPLGGALLAAVLLVTARRRAAAPAPDPERADVPLEITGLTKRYAGSSDRYAVRDLSFRVEKGQVLGLLGPNGAGKTTTLRMLMGLIRPDEGEIRVFGHAIRPGAPVLSRVGAFVEGAGFLPHLSGRENLELYWRATGRPAEDAHLAEALEIAGLGDALARAVRTYSQGMRQRLAIAQAMLGLPDLLILDEPTNGLDPPQIREMRDVMIRYAAGGRTVIVSSHLLSEVEQSCTHLVVMDRGRLVQAGPVAEITGESDTLLVTVDGELPDPVVEKFAALPGIGSVARVDEGLLVRLDGTSATAMIAELVRLDVPVTGVGPHRRLEDAFLTLIGGSA